MSNVKLLFISTGKGGSERETIEVYANENDEITIKIADIDLEFNPRFVTLDRQTAIKFCKELKRSIALLNEKEVQNG